jgi:hypothetical protein
MNKFRMISGLISVTVIIIVIGWGSKWFFFDSTSKPSESYSIAKVSPNLVEPSSLPAPEPSPTQPKSTNSEVKQEAAPFKPSYEILKNEADAKILALRNKAQSELLELVSQYQSVTAEKEKATLIAQGKTQMTGYDSRFAEILSAFQAQLIKHDYDISIITTYRQQYKQEKQIAQAFLSS